VFSGEGESNDSWVIERYVFGTPTNIWINLILPETSHCGTSLSLTVRVWLHWNFRGGLRKRMYFETECEMAVQGHPRSLIWVPIDSANAISLVTNGRSNLGPILPRFRDIASFLLRTTSPLFLPNFGGFPLGLDCRCCIIANHFFQLVDNSAAEYFGSADVLRIFRRRKVADADGCRS